MCVHTESPRKNDVNVNVLLQTYAMKTIPKLINFQFATFGAKKSRRALAGKTRVNFDRSYPLRVESDTGATHNSSCSLSSRSPMEKVGRLPRLPFAKAFIVDWLQGIRSASCCCVIPVASNSLVIF
jgi:hypothetical protein